MGGTVSRRELVACDKLAKHFRGASRLLLIRHSRRGTVLHVAEVKPVGESICTTIDTAVAAKAPTALSRLFPSFIDGRVGESGIVVTAEAQARILHLLRTERGRQALGFTGEMCAGVQALHFALTARKYPRAVIRSFLSEDAGAMLLSPKK